MGKIKKHPPVKLIVGFIFKDQTAQDKALFFLKRLFGKIDFESQTLSFQHTDYYQKEFGTGLKRKFISFKKLILPQDLAKIKNITNKIENKLSLRSLRRVNIDPGYLDLAKLILASTKDYRHRIYLGRGIFADVTLFFQNHAFRPLECTYPDYATREYSAIFNQIREIYAQQIKKK